MLVVAMLLAIVGGTLGWFRLPLDANTDSLIARDRPWMRDYLAFLEEFGDLEYLYVVVDTKGAVAEGERAVDDLLAGLAAIPGLPGVHGRITSEELLRLTARAAPLEDLRGLADAADALPVLASGEDWLAEGTRRLERLLTPDGLALAPSEQRALAAAGLLLLEAAASTAEASRGEQPSFPLANPPSTQTLASDSGRLLFIAILPRKDFGTLTAIEGPLRQIRAVVAEARERHPEVDIGLTGKPVLQADELATSVGDTTVAFSVGLTVVALLCVVVFRDWRRPLLALVAFAIAIAWTHGAAALLVGRLNLLSMVFMLVMIGAGLDYAIHVLHRYAEFRARHDVETSVRRTLRTVAAGTLTGATTSAAVFALALLSDFGGLRELGIIAGSGLLFCALAMVTVLPALLVLADDRRTPKSPLVLTLPGASIPRSARTATLTIVGFGICAALALTAVATLLRFESNLLSLQSPALESVVWEHRVLAEGPSTSWFGAVPCPDEACVETTIARAANEPAIAGTRSLFDVVAPTTAERDRLRARIAEETLPPTTVEAADAPLPSADAWTDAAGRLRSLAGLAAIGAERDQAASLRALADRLDRLGADEVETTSDPATSAATAAAIATSARAIVEGAQATLRESLPAALRDRFVSPSGMLLVQLLPARDTWVFESLTEFVEAMRRVAPTATGVPVTQSESIRDMFRAFVVISLWAVVVVSVIVWVDFRGWRAVLLCTGVLVVGILLTLGTLAVVGIPLSLANFFGIPILIGLGIDSNIHLLHRAREQPERRSLPFRFGATGSAVILTALTTAIGFGGQIFANHRGMQGLGWVIVIGSLVCLATTVWLLPALLRVVHGSREA